MRETEISNEGTDFQSVKFFNRLRSLEVFSAYEKDGEVEFVTYGTDDTATTIFLTQEQTSILISHLQKQIKT